MTITLLKKVWNYREDTITDSEEYTFDRLKDAYNFVEELKKEFPNSSSCLFNIHSPKETETHGLAYVKKVTLSKITKKPFNTITCDLELIIS